MATNDFGVSTGGPAVIGERVMPKDELALKEEKDAQEGQQTAVSDEDGEDVQVGLGVVTSARLGTDTPAP